MIEPLFAFEIVKEGFGGCVRVAFLVGKVAAMFGVGDTHQHLRGRAPFPLVYDLHRAQKILGIITTAYFDGVMKTYWYKIECMLSSCQLVAFMLHSMYILVSPDTRLFLIKYRPLLV